MIVVFDALFTDVSVGLVLVAVATVLVVASTVRRHPVRILAASVAVAGGYLLDVRGADVAIDALEALVSYAVEALLGLARVVDGLFAAVLEFVSGIGATDVGVPSPEVGVPGTAPSLGLLQFAAAMLAIAFLAGLVLVWLRYDAAGSPLNAWLGAVGVAFGVVGALWALFQSNPFGLPAGGLLASAVAAPVGLAFGVLAGLLALRPDDRVAAGRAEVMGGRYPTARRTPERDTDGETDSAGSGGGTRNA